MNGNPAGIHRSFHLGKQHSSAFYQTNTSQYCPLYALCTTGDRGMQQLAEHCPKFCEKYSLLYPEHLHMIGRYNSLFGVDKTLLESPEMWKK